MTMLGSKRDTNNSENSYTPPPAKENAATNNINSMTNGGSNEDNDSIDNLPFEENKTPF